MRQSVTWNQFEQLTPDQKDFYILWCKRKGYFTPTSDGGEIEFPNIGRMLEFIEEYKELYFGVDDKKDNDGNEYQQARLEFYYSKNTPERGEDFELCDALFETLKEAIDQGIEDQKNPRQEIGRK